MTVPLTPEELLDILTNLLPAELELIIARLNINESLLSGVQAPSAIRALEVIRYLNSRERLLDLDHLLRRLGVLRGPSPPPAALQQPPQLGHLRLGFAATVEAVLDHSPGALTLPAAALPRAPLLSGGRRAAAATSHSPQAQPGVVSLSFDLSNPNSAQMRLAGLSLRVLRYQPAVFVSVNARLASAHARRYRCELATDSTDYACEQRAADYDYIKLSAGEMEFFGIDVSAPRPGIYEVQAVVEYSVAGESGRLASVVQRFAYYDSHAKSPPLRLHKKDR